MKMLKLHHNHHICTKKLVKCTAGKCFSTTESRSSSSSKGDSNYLQRSILPTFHFQKSLPRLKIPELPKTLEKYVGSQKVILSAEELKFTENECEKFLKGLGEVLQKELVSLDKKNKHTSYISEPWFDMYLSSRLPLVLNFNPFITFTPDPRPEYRTQLIRATNMVVSSVKFMKSLRDELLEPEVFHLNPSKTDTEGYRKFCRVFPESLSWYASFIYSKQGAYPLDMSQFKRLFSSTRIPKYEKDDFCTDQKSKHLLVLRNGHMYIFDVLDANDNIVSPEVIMAHLQYIQQDQRPPPEYPLGPLTADDRDTWTTVRQYLVNEGNEDMLRLVDTAVFALCLDDQDASDPNQVTRQFLHGDGVNRWFDKSFSLILMPDSTACVNFEHAWGDGVAVLRYFNEVFKDSTENSVVGPSSKPASVNSTGIVQRLDFKLGPALKKSLSESKKRFDDLTGSLDVHHLEYYKFNKNYVKKQKISPDAIMQLAIQMAYYRQYRRFVGTYESCSTSAFKHGRTETLRSATMETKHACQLFVDKKHPTNAELMEAIVNCSKKHQQWTKDAAMGQGFDRHLFALRKLSEKKGQTLSFFSDPAYAKINHHILSTSTLSSPAVVIGGFAPVVPDGYGVGYSIEENRIGFNVTSYPPATNVRDFIDCAQQSLDQLFHVMENKNK